MLANCSQPCELRQLASLLTTGLRRELDLTPKPGLVDRWDNGSHPDLDYPLMRRSVGLLDGYFHDCARALRAGEPLTALRQLGRQAEERMLQRFGTNTHRGVIFLGGLLLAAFDEADSDRPAALSASVAAVTSRLFADGLPSQTTGARVRADYASGGIIDEASNGLPALFQVCLPALADAERLGLPPPQRLFLAMARLMQTVEDTTALRRCGRPGLRRLRQDGASLEAILLSNGNPLPWLLFRNASYRSDNLTMGGVADLLGIGVALHEQQRSACVQVATLGNAARAPAAVDMLAGRA